MRVLAVVIAACAVAQTVIAQTAERAQIDCRSGSRPACYYRAVPPAIAQRSSPAARPAASAEVDTPKSSDSLSAEEDERVNAQLRNICSGC